MISTPGAKSTGSGAPAPPHPYDKRWHVHADGKTYGPYAGHQIRKMVEQKQVIGSDFVYVEGDSGSAWLQIANDPILGALFQRPSLQSSTEAIRHPRRWLIIAPTLALAGWIA